MMVGLPFSGKTTFVEQFVNKIKIFFFYWAI